MADKDLKCAFDKQTGDAIIYKGQDPVKGAVIAGHGLKTSDGGLLDRSLGVKPGDDYFGTASIPGVGDPEKSKVAFHAFKINAQSMGCAVEELGIDNVPVVSTKLTPSIPASAPGMKP